MTAMVTFLILLLLFI